MSNDITIFSEIQIAELSIEQLKQEFAKSLSITADYLVYMAAIWQELQTRGVDMSELKSGLVEYVPLIASKMLDAQLVVSYAGQKTLLSVLSRLPLAEQQTLAQRGTVERVVLDDNDERVVETINLSSIKTNELTQVFGDDYIRSVDDQYILLKMRQKEKAKPQKTNYTRSRVRVVDNETLVIGGKSVKIKAMLDALSKYYDVDFNALIKEKS